VAEGKRDFFVSKLSDAESEAAETQTWVEIALRDRMYHNVPNEITLMKMKRRLKRYP
jgi:alcohol dehydrogenase class IV